MPYKDREKRQEYYKKYYSENREKLIEQSVERKRVAKKKDPAKYKEKTRRQWKKYYEKNKERVLERGKEWDKHNKHRYLLYRAKKRARDKSLPFDLELSDIVVPEFCPILGVKLEIQEGHSSLCSPSLDRIVPEKGYTKGNVQVISMRANQIKTDATADEIMAVAKYMKEHENDV
tara:strand:+ start:45 stop:569 length:525 start_codon:yes stop_codon:yes gene_type:complete